MSKPAAISLESPLKGLWGVGPERAQLLARMKLHTIGDLLLHRPRRHEDRRRFTPIAQMTEGVATTARGRVVASGIKRWKRGSRAMFECILEDGHGRLHLRWWQAYPWMEEHFCVGREFLVFGKVVSAKPRTMDHPETELIEHGDEETVHLNRIVPVYPLTDGLTQRWLRGLVWRTLAAHGDLCRRDWALDLGGPIPQGEWLIGLSEKHTRLPPREEAVRWLHFPDDMADVEVARQRLAMDEFIELQQAIQNRRRALQSNATALPCAGTNRLIKPFLGAIGFKLTQAQTRVLRDIRKDMGGTQPMRRLLQGDVGSGKTAVAACAALMTIESGYSVCLMAPTEILAEQHCLNFTRWLTPLAVDVELRTGGRKHASANPRAAHKGARPKLVIGTHALIEDAFAVDRLGLVIIDEQHKFGVSQRERLVRKGRYPHLLVMTATPIPRTLGLTLYGDLDISIIDELPKGRGRIRTFVRGSDKLPQVWEFVRTQIDKGRQAYVVYARVEESDPKAGIKAAVEEFDRLAAAIAPHKAALIHGRMDAHEKEAIMASFRRNETRVLLATSVIEVGVDVPNATVMVIENAEQFGLAQLHQLRGRIGRGSQESFCILVAAARTDDARQRLKVMEDTTDGFIIAEADLKLRGPGELLGRVQSGMPSLRFGDLATDRALVERARDLVAKPRLPDTAT